ncbi:hypothetical protein [Streptomyces sp. NPDC051776]|uniref:hypothetical protein n=1 Tax=Streptomyces sp. NPDC051776 TaxID=3155414 RepID=UPI003432CD9A
MPETPSGDDPLLRLQHEMQLQRQHRGLHATVHPDEILITGITVMCSQCGARRDWMVIRDRAEISIRCRCSYQWVERELTCADDQAMIDDGVGPDFPSLQAAAQAAGCDGTLAGTYLAAPGPQ